MPLPDSGASLDPCCQNVWGPPTAGCTLPHLLRRLPAASSRHSLWEGTAKHHTGCGPGRFELGKVGEYQPAEDAVIAVPAAALCAALNARYDAELQLLYWESSMASFKLCAILLIGHLMQMSPIDLRLLPWLLHAHCVSSELTGMGPAKDDNSTWHTLAHQST